MTRRNKHAARFGDRYQPPIDWRRFPDGLQKAQPAIHRMTEAFRCYHEALLAEWSPPSYVRQPDILDRIDDTLMTYDSQHADGDQPWPYGSF